MSKEKKQQTAYSCSKCGVAVIIIKGEKPIKPCKCEAPIIANMEATAYAVSKMATN